MKAILVTAFNMQKATILGFVFVSVACSLVIALAPFESLPLTFITIYLAAIFSKTYYINLEKNNSTISFLAMPIDRKTLAKSYYYVSFILIAIGLVPIVISSIKVILRDSQNIFIFFMLTCFFMIIFFISVPVQVKFTGAKADIILVLLIFPFIITLGFPNMIQTHTSMSENFTFLSIILIVITIISFIISFNFTKKIVMKKDY